MIDQQIKARCKDRLITVARARDTISYGELASSVGVANQSVGIYLDAIYEEETAVGNPDFTVVVVYSGTEMGRFNSRGAPVRSVPVDPGNPDHVKAYRAERERVYDHWAP
jgi:hypothetical protein